MRGKSGSQKIRRKKILGNSRRTLLFWLSSVFSCPRFPFCLWFCRVCFLIVVLCVLLCCCFFMLVCFLGFVLFGLSVGCWVSPISLFLRLLSLDLGSLFRVSLCALFGLFRDAFADVAFWICVVFCFFFGCLAVFCLYVVLSLFPCLFLFALFCSLLCSWHSAVLACSLPFCLLGVGLFCGAFLAAVFIGFFLVCFFWLVALTLVCGWPSSDSFCPRPRFSCSACFSPPLVSSFWCSRLLPLRLVCFRCALCFFGSLFRLSLFLPSPSGPCRLYSIRPRVSSGLSPPVLGCLSAPCPRWLLVAVLLLFFIGGVGCSLVSYLNFLSL